MKTLSFEECLEQVAKENGIDFSGNLFPTLEQEIKFYKEAAKLLAKEAIRLARENLSFTIGSTLPMTNQEILDQLFKPKDSNEQKAE